MSSVYLFVSSLAYLRNCTPDLHLFLCMAWLGSLLAALR